MKMVSVFIRAVLQIDHPLSIRYWQDDGYRPVPYTGVVDLP
ncbi:MAG: hypothetical protein BMS9Abin06_0019 [Gammaproteobacteria bacterium]|nr:MAG: hypothetical protein BMS9Abin06_0019 [Gammaproteobacteria bacterium]